jgi:hypothetical protein
VQDDLKQLIHLPKDVIKRTTRGKEQTVFVYAPENEEDTHVIIMDWTRNRVVELKKRGKEGL